MDEKERQEFSLEDILKEFGDEPEPAETVEEEVLPEEPAEEPAEAPEEVPAEAPPAMDGGSTIRFERIPGVVGKVNNAQHIDDEDEPYIPPQPEPSAEP